MTNLAEALSTNRDAIARALPEAEERLAACRAHCDELEAQIRLARLIVSGQPAMAAPASTSARVPMHQVMAEVLKDLPDGLPAPELARQIDEGGLYRRLDGGKAGLSQVHARVNNYPTLFIRDQGRIRLRRPSDPPRT